MDGSAETSFFLLFIFILNSCLRLSLTIICGLLFLEGRGETNGTGLETDFGKVDPCHRGGHVGS